MALLVKDFIQNNPWLLSFVTPPKTFRIKRSLAKNPKAELSHFLRNVPDSRCCHQAQLPDVTLQMNRAWSAGSCAGDAKHARALSCLRRTARAATAVLRWDPGLSLGCSGLPC